MTKTPIDISDKIRLEDLAQKRANIDRLSQKRDFPAETSISGQYSDMSHADLFARIKSGGPVCEDVE